MALTTAQVVLPTDGSESIVVLTEQERTKLPTGEPLESSIPPTSETQPLIITAPSSLMT